MKKLFSRYGVLIVTALLLIGAFIVNMNTSSDADDVVETVAGSAEKMEEKAAVGQAEATNTQENYFEAFRQERSDTRAIEIECLDEVIATSGSDAETLADAQEQKLALVENMEKEFTVESLIKAKGFHDVAVTFHAGSVNVIVDSEALDDRQVAQILDIVMRETGESADNIKIQTGN